MFSEPCGSDLCTFVFVPGKGIILGTAVIYTHLCTLVFVPGKGITLGTAVIYTHLCTLVFVPGKGITLGTAVIYTHLCTLVFVPGKGITLGTHKLSLSVSWYFGRYTHARAHTRMHTHTRGRKGLNVCSDQISILFEVRVSFFTSSCSVLKRDLRHLSQNGTVQDRWSLAWICIYVHTHICRVPQPAMV
jgi:hypothetical protein